MINYSSQDKESQFNVTGTTGEVNFIRNLPYIGRVVMDVGANVGEWTLAVLEKRPDIEIHAFEPVPQIYQQLLQNVGDAIQLGNVIPVNCAIAHQEGIRTFFSYETHGAWSTFYRRYAIEQSLNLIPPKPISVFTTTLDDYCKQRNIRHVGFLKIDVEGGEWDVVLGAKELLQQGQIDCLQFEYGGTWQDANISLKQMFAYLHQYHYHLFKILPNQLDYRPQFLLEYEDYSYSNFLAVSDRLRPYFFNESPQMLALPSLFNQYGITPKNVIHVGAHEGQEIDQYQQMNVQGVLFIEANPDVFERLEANVAEIDNMVAIQCAVSNQSGTVTLRITTSDEASSILPLKHHQDIYPDIQETHQITVLSTTLDELLEEWQLDFADFNILYLDIQGAELLALEGAVNLLPYLDGVYTEVNYEELYEGCALIGEIDEFLASYEFLRVETVSPYHPSWGDALYVKKPLITMSTLGQNGRFANQIFQYAFLKIYAQIHQCRVQTSPWIGQLLFGHADSIVTQPLPVVGNPDDPFSPALAESLLPHADIPYKNVEFWGFFQYHTRFYAPHKDYFRSLFKPVTAFANALAEALQRLRSHGKTIVGLHLRRGDYGYGYFFVAPTQWYRDWLTGFWDTLENPVLFIASDDIDAVIGDFEEYKPLSVRDLKIDLPEAPFYPDFYLLSQCDVVAISNSSFSFAACLVNERSQFFFRPHLSSGKLIPFDPWNSEPVLRHETVEGLDNH